MFCAIISCFRNASAEIFSYPFVFQSSWNFSLCIVCCRNTELFFFFFLSIWITSCPYTVLFLLSIPGLPADVGYLPGCGPAWQEESCLTFPLTTSRCFPSPWVSLDSLRFMLFSFVSPQSLEIGHLKFFLRNIFLEEGRERSRLLLILHIGLPWNDLFTLLFVIYLSINYTYMVHKKNLWILLKNISLLLYSILIWTKKPWTLGCLNFYNKISFFSVAKQSHCVPRSCHVPYSSVHLCLLSSFSRMTLCPLPCFVFPRSLGCEFSLSYLSFNGTYLALFLQCRRSPWVNDPTFTVCGVLHVSKF